MAESRNNQAEINAQSVADALSFYVLEGLKIPIWLQDKINNLSDQNNPFIGFDEADGVRNIFDDRGIDLPEGDIVFADSEMTFDEINNTRFSAEEKHDLILVFCNQQEREKALGNYQNKLVSVGGESSEESRQMIYKRIGEIYASSADERDQDLSRAYASSAQDRLPSYLETPPSYQDAVSGADERQQVRSRAHAFSGQDHLPSYLETTMSYQDAPPSYNEVVSGASVPSNSPNYPYARSLRTAVHETHL